MERALQTGQSRAWSGAASSRVIGITGTGDENSRHLRRFGRYRGLGALVGALAVAAAGAVILAFVQLGPLSGHMVAHIASMNVVAPLAAVGIGRHYPKSFAEGIGWKPLARDAGPDGAALGVA